MGKFGSSQVRDNFFSVECLHVCWFFLFVHFVFFLYTFQREVQLKTEEKVPVSTIDRGSHHEVANPFDIANLKHEKRKSFIVFYRGSLFTIFASLA